MRPASVPDRWMPGGRLAGSWVQDASAISTSAPWASSCTASHMAVSPV
ncbi:Uncharacterised protein [Mycobacteroides abscessus subsp. abscessus]|nr:Uncharacterised protein [Mycobacteroides abscessus subsp. abscessus]